MKRISVVLFALLLLVCLSACGVAKLDEKQEGFAFSYGGCKIMPNSEAAPIIAVLGEPQSYTEEASCAFDGKDKTYFYGSFYLSTYPLNGKDYVYRIWFVDDSVATQEGIRIGNSQKEVEDICEAGCFRGTNAYTRTQNGTKLTILLTDGCVSSIQYEAVID